MTEDRQGDPVVAFLVRMPDWIARRVPRLAGLSARLRDRPELVRGIAILNLAFGSLLGIYTGILLSSLGARPLWNSAALAPIFLVSGSRTTSSC